MIKAYGMQDKMREISLSDNSYVTHLGKQGITVSHY